MLRLPPLLRGAEPGEGGGQAVLGMGGSGRSERRLPGGWVEAHAAAVVSQAHGEGTHLAAVLVSRERQSAAEFVREEI